MAKAKVGERLLAATSIFTAALLYSEIFLAGTNSLILSFVPSVSALTAPSLGVPVFVTMFSLELYRLQRFLPLLALLPFQLLLILKNIHSWVSSTLLLLVVPLAITHPSSIGVILGILYYLAWKEKPREAFFTGLSFIANLFAFSLLLSISEEIRAPLLILPGGLQASENEVTNAVLFYSTLFNALVHDSRFIAEIIVLLSSLTATSLVGERTFASLITPQVTLLAITPIIGSPSLADAWGIASSMGTSAMLYFAESSQIALHSRIIALVRGFTERRRVAEEDKLKIAFADLESLGETAQFLCRTLPPGRKIVILGLSYEEEKAFTEYFLDGLKCSADVILFHRIGLEGLLKLPPQTTVVLYLRFLDEKTSLTLLSKLTGYDPETVEKLVQPYKEKLTRVSRVALYFAAQEINKRIKQGLSARRAFNSVLSRVKTDLSEEFIRVLEQVSARYEVIGFAS
ncbi:hypothetical protein [Infirmifilum sp. NZ]|uniref:hypothetical protein n=1 Tax=Infirmifilum sp. NZ TaxID=2926850 RepID=UPI00279B395E|nr:hypothetical protein [Infirmifilum sp. NZ]UNQ74209.1 hypothetical protein MOV14_04120 [Infirmifilum sp. NZ]